MSIYRPEVYLSDTDKELLALLAELLVTQINRPDAVNYERGNILISDVEARRLIELLEEFTGSKKFREGSYFADCLVGEIADEKTAKEIYLSWRARHGRSRAVASMQWQNFLARVGIGQTSEGFPPVWYRANAAPMEFTYFLKMERKLATAAGLNPRIRELIIRFVEAREITIEKLRCREIALEQNAILQPPKLLLDMLVGGSDNRIGHAPMSATQIGAVMTIVLDVSTIFTTRDWSVTGFLSTLAGAVAPATVK